MPSRRPSALRQEGLRLTPVRRKVLELLLREHRAWVPTPILDLSCAAPGSARSRRWPIARSISSTQHGFAHKIERLNAFVACAHPGQSHSPAFMICRLCDAVAEAQSAPAKGALGDAARAAGFQIERTVVEAEGVCPACADKADA
jgi:Fur family zinc uptake transcriptional regulator